MNIDSKDHDDEVNRGQKPYIFLVFHLIILSFISRAFTGGKNQK